MTNGVYAERVDASFDVAAVGIGNVLRNRGIFGVEIYAVAGNLSELAGPVVPVKALEITCVIVVVCVVGVA